MNMKGFYQEEEGCFLRRNFGGTRPSQLYISYSNVGLWRPWNSPMQTWAFLHVVIVTLGEILTLLACVGRVLTFGGPMFHSLS
jgi:hypothetical protein